MWQYKASPGLPCRAPAILQQAYERLATSSTASHHCARSSLTLNLENYRVLEHLCLYLLTARARSTCIAHGDTCTCLHARGVHYVAVALWLHVGDHTIMHACMHTCSIAIYLRITINIPSSTALLIMP